MQNKRSLFVCLLVILTLCATLAVAAEGSSLEIIVGVDDSTPAVVYEGETFVVNVEIANNTTGISVLQFALDYDAENLEYVSFANGDVFEEIVVQKRSDGQLVCMYMGTDSDVENGTVVSYTFKAKKTIDPKASFKIESDGIGGMIGNADGSGNVAVGGAVTDDADKHLPVQGNPPVDEDGNITVHTHVYTKTEYSATCENDRYDRYQCDCGYYYDDVYENTATGHDYTDWLSNGDNTHTKTCPNEGCETPSVTENCAGGTATCEGKATCTACGEKYGDVLGHNYGAWVSNGDNTHTKTCPNANCETPSVTEDCAGGTATCEGKATCTACGEKYGDVLNHNYGAWVSNGDNTHTKTCPNEGCETPSVTEDCAGGTATCEGKATCTACGEKYGDANGHTPGGEATCTSAQKCTVCNKELNPARGHTEEIIPAVEPSYTEEGATEGKKCTVCGTITDAPDVIPAKSLAWLWILIVAVAVIGAGVAVYFFVLRKKVK